MKRLLSLLVFVIMFLCSSSVKADIYTDGLKVLMKMNVLPLGTGHMDEMQSDMIDSLIVAVAPHYRDNMTEAEFKQMLDFYNREDVKAANAKFIGGVTALENGIQQLISGVVMSIAQGQTPDDIAPVECDEEYKKAFDRYCKVNNVEETLSHILDPMMSALDQNMGNVPEDRKQQMKDVMTKLVNYIGRNIKPMILGNIKDNVTIADLNILSSISEQPFYAASKKADQSMINDLGTIVGKMLGGLGASR